LIFICNKWTQRPMIYAKSQITHLENMCTLIQSTSFHYCISTNYSHSLFYSFGIILFSRLFLFVCFSLASHKELLIIEIWGSHGSDMLTLIFWVVMMLCFLVGGYQHFRWMLVTTYKTTWHHNPEDHINLLLLVFMYTWSWVLTSTSLYIKFKTEYFQI
jgi:hypothetical protein